MNVHAAKIGMRGSLDGITGKHGITRVMLIVNNPQNAPQIQPRNGNGDSSDLCAMDQR